MTIVVATPLHAPLFAALHGASFKSGWDEDAFEKLLALPGTAAWIWQDEEPRGFILVRAVADEAEIITIAVLPASRQQGIGAALLKFAAKDLQQKNVRDFFLEVASDNTAARALYESAGFKICGERKNYYREGGKRKDALIMKCVF